ncbi:alginate lyase family protein [Aquihabitans sp. McL0605]|uniref:alginate lyase family protein n=1 Tax=Aquihabitans sp. McL0605 TaxID=3415671 RepID=UPI003CF89298
MPRDHCSRLRLAGGTIVLAAVLLSACTAVSHDAGPPSTTTSSAPQVPAPTVRAPGALRGLAGLERSPAPEERQRLVAAADGLLGHQARPERTLEVDTTDGPFVVDAQAAWTLALAGHVTGDERYRTAAAAIVDAWVSEAKDTAKACPNSGACSTSLMVSRSAPGMVFAVDALTLDGSYGEAELAAFHAWLRHVILPVASNRDNNWGDAGTYLKAVVGAELGDGRILASAAKRWKQRIDLIEPDGRIPEEIRRGDASLMYSQEALDYKVATADVLHRTGTDVWNDKGAKGGTLEAALALVASGLDQPKGWPGGKGDLRVPEPAGLWLMVVERWGQGDFARLAADAAQGDGKGHSAVLWTGITHPLER